MPEKQIRQFKDEFRYLSNFHPCSIVFEEEVYPSVEHAYQAAKTLDLHERALIRAKRRPGEAKKAGQQVVLRPDWEEVKLSIMEHLLRQKFASGNLRIWLLATKGYELIEGNYWNDTFWGVCNGVGENHLGKLLMKIREEFLK